MSSHADNSRQEKFHPLLTLKPHGPKSFHKIAHFPWGYLSKFPMVSYKMLGPLCLTVSPWK
jgi:hypothetical protein